MKIYPLPFLAALALGGSLLAACNPNRDAADDNATTTTPATPADVPPATDSTTTTPPTSTDPTAPPADTMPSDPASPDTTTPTDPGQEPAPPPNR